MSDKATIYVVDDDDQARKAVMTLLAAMGVDIVGFASAEEFLAAYDGRRPSCLITDVRMVGMSGLELQDELRRRNATIPVIVLTAFATTSSAVRAMKSGAVTVLEKPGRDDELWEAVRDALNSDRQAHTSDLSREELRRRLDSLTPRERAVLDCITAGDANKVVARKLGCSVRTVELHRSSVFQKMGADSLAELVRQVVAVESSD